MATRLAGKARALKLSNPGDLVDYIQAACDFLKLIGRGDYPRSRPIPVFMPARKAPVPAKAPKVAPKATAAAPAPRTPPRVPKTDHDGFETVTRTKRNRSEQRPSPSGQPAQAPKQRAKRAPAPKRGASLQRRPASADDVSMDGGWSSGVTIDSADDVPNHKGLHRQLALAAMGMAYAPPSRPTAAPAAAPSATARVPNHPTPEAVAASAATNTSAPSKDLPTDVDLASPVVPAPTKPMEEVD